MKGLIIRFRIVFFYSIVALHIIKHFGRMHLNEITSLQVDVKDSIWCNHKII